jgi:hypothetical protein
LPLAIAGPGSELPPAQEKIAVEQQFFPLEFEILSESF